MAISVALILTSCASLQNSGISPSKQSLATAGAEEKDEIENVLSAELHRVSNLRLTAKITHLRIVKGWAWAVAFPKRLKGQEPLEPTAALLRKERDHWKIIERIDGEELSWVDRPDVLRAKFPKAPPAIFEGSKLH